MAMYSVPTTLTGTSWSPAMSAHPPYAPPLSESSLMVTAMGLVEVIRLPEGWSLVPTLMARPDQVWPALSVMVNATFAGCPTRAFLGVIVTCVLFSVATISKPDGDWA